MKFLKGVLSFSFLFLVVIFLFASCSNDQSTILARVGGRKISLKQFEKEFGRGKTTNAARAASYEDKKVELDRMIDKQLKIVDAYQHGLDKDEKILNQVNERENSIMFSRLIDMEVTEKVVPESEIKDFYEKASKEIKVRQILVKFDPNDEKQKSDALKRAKKIISRLKEKEAFTKIAEAESDDINTAKKGGDKGYLKWGPKSSENPVYKTAFELRLNEISDAIEMKNGYYILKVVHIRQYPTPPFEQEKERIRQRIFSMRRSDIEKAYYEYLDRLRLKYKLKFLEPNLELFIKKINEPKQDGTTREKFQPLDNFTENDLKKQLATFTNREITVANLVNDLKKIPSHRLPRMKSSLEVQNFLNTRIVPLQLLEMEVKAKGVKNDGRVKSQVKNFKENIMINNIQKQEVYDKLNITDEIVRQFYDENAADYMHPESREVQEIYVKDEQLAKTIVTKARAGANYTSLFNRYNEKKALNENKGKLGFITAGRGGIGKPAFAVEVGGVTDPIKLGDGYSTIKVLSKKEPQQKTFEEAEKIATARLRRIKIEEKESEWLAVLKSKIDVVIYEKYLEKAMKNYIGPDIQTVN